MIILGTLPHSYFITYTLGATGAVKFKDTPIVASTTNVSFSSNTQIEKSEEQKLDKIRLQSIEKAAETMRKSINDKTGHPSWLLHELEIICNRLEKPLEMHNFAFERSIDAAKWNEEILRSYDNSYEKPVEDQPNTTISPGSEFRPTKALEALLKYRNDWDDIKKIIDEGVWYPMSQAPDNDTRIQDAKAMIVRGNHKSSTKLTSKSIVHKR